MVSEGYKDYCYCYCALGVSVLRDSCLFLQFTKMGSLVVGFSAAGTSNRRRHPVGAEAETSV